MTLSQPKVVASLGDIVETTAKRVIYHTDQDRV
jgi:hypothetical protein